MEKVIAVVVTYNRQNLLSECINALKNQTKKLDKIFIVNNGSTDDTEKWLEQQPGIEFITQLNSGGAGGFNTGINYGYKNGYSWIWVMDDDGYPKEDALEKLLEDDTEQLCLRNCAVLNKEDKKSFVWKTKNFRTIDEVKTNVINNVCYPFNGTLLHRKIVERVGLPKASLFLWGDETEYYYRIIRKNKIPFYTVTNSIHYHPATAFTYKADWNYSTGWKMYYYLRNRFYILKSKFSKNLALASLMYIGFLILFAATVVVFQKTNKIKKLSFIFWPATDAFANNLEATPEAIIKRLTEKTPYTHVFTDKYFKGFRTLFTTNATAIRD